jgi:hypothetical protein
MKALIICLFLILAVQNALAGLPAIARPIPIMVTQENLRAKGIAIRRSEKKEGLLAIYAVDFSVRVSEGVRYEKCELVVLNHEVQPEALKLVDDERTKQSARIARNTVYEGSFAFSSQELVRAYIAIQVRFSSDGREVCQRYLLPLATIK